MSLVPRWKSILPKPYRASDFYNLGSFCEDMEYELESFSSYPSGLSITSGDTSIFIEAAVPELTAKDIEVSVDNNHVLWIKGENKFSYCVPLWEEIDTAVEPEVVCKDGVMRIIFTKRS